jgi:hypothetical protein
MRSAGETSTDTHHIVYHSSPAYAMRRRFVAPNRCPACSPALTSARSPMTSLTRVLYWLRRLYESPSFSYQGSAARAYPGGALLRR